MDIPPQMPLAAASDITQKPCQFFSNYNDVDTELYHGVTEIQDIITSAYSADYFKLGVSFPGLLVPLQFNYKSTYQQCLAIFEDVATDGQFEILDKTGMYKT